MKVLLIIPAYNEAENIERVVDELIESYSQYDYVIVNDGSTDETAEICRRRGYRFLDLPVNLGLSGAFQAGMKYADSHDYDCAIQFDADGQHLPEYLDGMVCAMEGHDIVLGMRAAKEDQPTGLRKVGSKMLIGMIWATTHVKLTDPTSGMRAYGRRAIHEMAYGANLGPEPDTIAYLVRKKGLKICEVPMRMAERIAGESYLNLKNSGLYMARMALSVLLIQFFR